MHIKKIIKQYRRDFVAEFECEHCKRIEELTGYDDVYFHRRVIPKMKCNKCGKHASDKYTPRDTKYPELLKV